MYSKFLKSWVISENESIYKAHWQLHAAGGILLVIGDNEKFKGVITYSDMEKTYFDETLNLSDICNRKCKYIIEDADIYASARNLFGEFPWVNHLPVLDHNNNIIDMMTRDRAFYREKYFASKLPRMHYAQCMWQAVDEAKTLGYDSVSIIEFGVAGGNGLVNCEFHAKELSRIFGIRVEVYGFDTAEGLPAKNMGYKDKVHFWKAGNYHMNRSLLEDRLQFAKLVIGDINETAEDFIEKYSPAPIGCIFVDVDYYSSTLPILRMLERTDNKNFLPRIHMYFDDIDSLYEFQGEDLAIREFNNRNENIKISPENTTVDYRSKIKICHRFTHDKYNINKAIAFELPLKDCYI